MHAKSTEYLRKSMQTASLQELPRETPKTTQLAAHKQTAPKLRFTYHANPLSPTYHAHPHTHAPPQPLYSCTPPLYSQPKTEIVRPGQESEPPGRAEAELAKTRKVGAGRAEEEGEMGVPNLVKLPTCST